MLKKWVEINEKTWRNSEELLWAQIWNDTKKGIEWINGLSGLTPGRAAVGYNYLYVMSRILNEMKPTNVLDIGLGVSSTLISGYYIWAGALGEHTIIEHDKCWADFYTRSHKLSSSSKIRILEMIKKVSKGCSYNAYKDFSETITGHKYSIISIDGPIGWDMPYKCSRRDVLDIIPQSLFDSFIIIMDDYNRRGERDTVNDIERILDGCSIDYYKGIYNGLSDCCVIASADNKYFCTL